MCTYLSIALLHFLSQSASNAPVKKKEKKRYANPYDAHQELSFIIITIIIMYSFTCYFSKWEHIIHYKVKNRNTVKTNPSKHMGMHAHTHTCMHARTHTCMHARTHTRTHRHKRMHTHTHTHTHSHRVNRTA